MTLRTLPLWDMETVAESNPAELAERVVVAVQVEE
jgi:hypothetical protein